MDIFRNPGSFRDPSGFVVHADGRIFRLLNDQSLKIFNDIKSLGLLDELTKDGLLVETRLVSDDEESAVHLKAEFPYSKAVLEHPKVGLPVYPS